MTTKKRPSVEAIELPDNKKPKYFLCLLHENVGCEKSFPPEQYWFSSNMCRACTHAIAGFYEIDMDSVGAVGAVLQNLKWYISKFPQFETVEKREQVRILLKAANIEIKNPTERELKSAEFWQKKVTTICKKPTEINFKMV